MNMRHFLKSVRRLMEVIEKRMEPNRLSIRLFGDARTTTPEVTEVQVQV
jgi:hypothetical protein